MAEKKTTVKKKKPVSNSDAGTETRSQTDTGKTSFGPGRTVYIVDGARTPFLKSVKREHSSSIGMRGWNAVLAI